MKGLGELTQAADKANIPGFLDFLVSHAKSVGYSDKRTGEIKTAVEEALTNTVEFVCTEGGEEITLKCGDDKGRRFVVEMTDSGKPYNMLLEADPFLSGAAPGQKMPSVRYMKKIGDAEYKRYEGKNFITITVYPEFGSSTKGLPE